MLLFLLKGNGHPQSNYTEVSSHDPAVQLYRGQWVRVRNILGLGLGLRWRLECYLFFLWRPCWKPTSRSSPFATTGVKMCKTKYQWSTGPHGHWSGQCSVAPGQFYNQSRSWVSWVTFTRILNGHQVPGQLINSDARQTSTTTKYLGQTCTLPSKPMYHEPDLWVSIQEINKTKKAKINY